MPEITIYTKLMCPYCHAAKRLLRQKGAEVREIDVSFDRTRREEMRERTGGAHRVPQIFIGETHVGGCDALYALEDEGELDSMLAA